MSAPFFTIITATCNAAATLPRLLESLAGQTCRDFELIIQDGASADETVAIAESYRDRLPALSLNSEPDTGIYDAWNKALTRIRGQWVLFLGADDRLAESGCLQKARDVLGDANEHVLFAAGDVILFSADGVYQKIFPTVIENAVNRLRSEMPFCHTGLFHRKCLFSFRRFDPTYRVLGDYEFLCAVLHNDSQIIKLSVLVTHMFMGGVSNALCNQPFIFRESVRVAWKHFGRVTGHHFRVGCIVALIVLFCRLFGSRGAKKIVDAIRKCRGKTPRGD